jgi:hypothetical protein
MRQGDGESGLHASPCFGGRRLVSPTVSHKHAPNRRARIDDQGRYPGTRYLALLRRIAGVRYPGPTCQTSIRWLLQLSLHTTQPVFVRRVHNSDFSTTPTTFRHCISPIERPSGRARVVTFPIQAWPNSACLSMSPTARF